MRMSRITVIVLFVAIAVVAFLAGRGFRSEDTGRAENRTVAPTESPARTAEFESLKTDHKDARAEFSRRVHAEENRVKATPTEELEPTLRDPKEPRFIYEEQAEALRAVDWKSVGQSMHNLQPIIGKLVEALKAGKSPQTVDGIGDIQRWNGPLVSEGVRAKKLGISGYHVNGAFTHPAITVNAVYVTLREAGQPLTESQEEALRALGDRFIAAETRRVAAYTDQTMEAQKVLDECTLKEELYSEVDKMLSEPQREALHPKAIRGTAGADLFSSGLVWMQVARPLSFTSRENLVTQLESKLLGGMGIPTENREAAKSIVAEWVAGLDDAFLSTPYSPEYAKGLQPVVHIFAGAKRFLVLRTRLIAAVSNADAQLKMRRDPGVIVPYLKVAHKPTKSD
jgi:hypothetical protein